MGLGIWQSYRMRLRRKRSRIRARLKRRDLSVVQDRTSAIGRGAILVFTCFKDENIRLPHFLRYYREMGVDHFLMVDNGSTDGGREYLAAQPDVSLWTTRASYKEADFGVAWLNGLQMIHAEGHWCLTVDPDELFIYPFCDTRPIRALTDWLDASSIRSFSAMLLDLYPKGPVDQAHYARDQDPLAVACWFDAGNYMISRNYLFGNLWIQGGPRARMFFRDEPYRAPALNKVPLVKWGGNFAYTSSTHMLLPRGLNLVYDEWGGEKASGVLLHTKLMNTFVEKARDESVRAEHYAEGREYQAYAEGLAESTDFWCTWSERYINWRQLEILGIMSKGNWA